MPPDPTPREPAPQHPDPVREALREAVGFLDSFVMEWLTDFGADESQLEGVRKRVEFYRTALADPPLERVEGEAER